MIFACCEVCLFRESVVPRVSPTLVAFCERIALWNDTKLQDAVEAFGEALTEWTRERVPLDWATAQNNLGNALTVLGERENNTKTLQKAVEAYGEALKERTRERVPPEWASTQNNLGNALASLGKRETDPNGTKTLQKAVEALGEALKEWTRERAPRQWASAQNNLGVALMRLGERENDTNVSRQPAIALRYNDGFARCPVAHTAPKGVSTAKALIATG